MLPMVPTVYVLPFVTAVLKSALRVFTTNVGAVVSSTVMLSIIVIDTLPASSVSVYSTEYVPTASSSPSKDVIVVPAEFL